MKGTFKLAFKLLVNDTAKFTALLMGITFAVFLMMFVTSMFVGVLNHASLRILEQEIDQQNAATEAAARAL